VPAPVANRRATRRNGCSVGRVATVLVQLDGIGRLADGAGPGAGAAQARRKPRGRRCALAHHPDL